MTVIPRNNHVVYMYTFFFLLCKWIYVCELDYNGPTMQNRDETCNAVMSRPLNKFIKLHPDLSYGYYTAIDSPKRVLTTCKVVPFIHILYDKQ